MTLPTVEREGDYCRVCKPDWLDCEDTSYAKTAGGRWNPKGDFGALYLNATREVAAAQARHQHVGRAIKLFDLRPERRPELAWFPVPRITVVDAVSDDGILALGLPATYPFDVPWSACQTIARRDYHERGGVAARSAAEAQPGFIAGEELAVFDTLRLNSTHREPFGTWYPDPIP